MKNGNYYSILGMENRIETAILGYIFVLYGEILQHCMHILRNCDVTVHFGSCRRLFINSISGWSLRVWRLVASPRLQTPGKRAPLAEELVRNLSMQWTSIL